MIDFKKTLIMKATVTVDSKCLYKNPAVPALGTTLFDNIQKISEEICTECDIQVPLTVDISTYLDYETYQYVSVWKDVITIESILNPILNPILITDEEVWKQLCIKLIDRIKCLYKNASATITFIDSEVGYLLNTNH